MMENKMFCFQCEQTAGCAGCMGGAGRLRQIDTANLQDELTGALIGLARAAGGDTDPAESIYSTILEGLFTTITNVSFDDEAIRRQIDKTHAEKAKLISPCCACASPCGHSDDYEMKKLWDDNEDLRSLKSLILFGLRGMAAYAYHARMLGYRDEEVDRFFCEGLFAVGEDLTMEQLLPIVMRVGEVNLKCMALLDRANTETLRHTGSHHRSADGGGGALYRGHGA